MRRITTLALLTLAAALVVQAASAASPDLRAIYPRGIQRGVEQVLSFRGARLQDTQEVFFYSPGFEVLKIDAAADNKVDVTVKAAADCRLGEHAAQLRTATGISDYLTFYVGNLPSVEEKEPNNEFEAPQEISLNVTVEGVANTEDVDYYVVEAKKGQRIAAEVEGMRLGTTLFDPYVAILDSKRFELATADDTPLVYQDCVAAVIAPEDGKYIIEVRESAYQGNGNCRYRMHVGTFPRPLAAYPAGGKLGEELEVTFIGDPAGDFKQKFTLPGEKELDYGVYATADGQIAPSANPIRLFEHGNAFEAEPNNGLAEATPAELPLAFNGIIAEPGDIDCFKFTAKKGETYEVECFARRVRSPLDAVMNVYTADGKGVGGNDDSRGPDSYLRFNVPADGEYIVRVTDHLDRGGPEFVYRVEFHPVSPSLALSIPRNGRYSQERQRIVVPKGNRFAVLFSASRSGFGGDLVFDGSDLPSGVNMITENMPANQNTWPVVFEAAPDAPVAGKLSDFTARHVEVEKNISGGFKNTADLVRGAPGQTVYWTKDVNRLAMAVVEEAPFHLEIVEPKVPVVKNGTMQLKVIAKRKEGFTAPIKVEFPYRSPGVNAASSVTIPENQSEVLYPINASGNAQTGKFPVFALGTADVSGPVWVSSQLAHLEVADPFIDFALERTAVEQGKPTQVFGKITHNAPFEGEATVKLVGLPNKVTAPELKITKDSQEISFPVTTDPTSPDGRHKNIFCQVVITMNGEPIHHNVGSTELRIDKPLPKPVAKKPEPEKVAAKEPEKKPEPQAKPLSRLEMLRQMAKEAAGGAE